MNLIKKVYNALQIDLNFQTVTVKWVIFVGFLFSLYSRLADGTRIQQSTPRELLQNYFTHTVNVT